MNWPRSYKQAATTNRRGYSTANAVRCFRPHRLASNSCPQKENHPNGIATFTRAHLEITTKVRRKRAPVAELESSANPQPGKAALRSARFPACGFWPLSSRQMVVLSSAQCYGRRKRNLYGEVKPG